MFRNYNSPYSTNPTFPSGLDENIPAQLQMPQPGIYELHLRQQKRLQMQQFARDVAARRYINYNIPRSPNMGIQNQQNFRQPQQAISPSFYRGGFNSPFTPYVGQNSTKSRRQQEACAALRVNGCGPGGWINKLIGHIQNDFDFTQACNNHDTNFGTLGFGFERANSQFYQEMRSVPDKIDESGNRITSERTAGVYFAAVSGPMGKYYYNKAQENARICRYGE